jgi:glycosyltransferase involved in cell wall biosynthesis
MRVALIAPPWLPVPPVAYGGTEQVIDQLARGLHERGHEVVLFTTGDSTCPVAKDWVLESTEGVVLGDVVTELRHVSSAYRRLKGFDVIHDHTLSGPLCSAFFPTPVVTTNHGPFSRELEPLYRVIGRKVPIVAISHSQARTSPVPVAKVIHHGVDVSQFPLGSGDGGYLLFLGRMARDKGVAEAARVARRAGARLLIAAKMRETAERLYFEAEVKPLLGGSVEYLGEVDWNQKLDLLAGAAALINPIRWPEPFGLVMVEAMACGTPVVTFGSGAAPEIVAHGETGFVCSSEDEMVLALSRLGSIDRAACRKRVEAHFSAERMVEDHLALYRELAGRRPTGGRRREAGAPVVAARAPLPGDEVALAG